MILFLCEKPSQARDIGRVLGATSRHDGYLEGQGKQVTWCIGHLLEMTTPDGYTPEWKSWRLDALPMIPTQWKLEVTKRGRKQFTIIKKLLKGVQEVVLATDADREGETIGREVLERCRYRGNISRLWLSALDDASIRRALGTCLPGTKTEPLYQAGMGRARADWLVGMNLSRAYTLLGRQAGYDGVLSVGRVQTPTLKLVVDRDRQIEQFKPVGYFEVLALLVVAKGRFQAQWIPGKTVSDEEGRCLDGAVAAKVVQKVRGETGQITSAETKRIKEAPPLPLELSTLQQEASRRWGMRAKTTLETAQDLYEKYKAITYPRTDCRFLPTQQFRDVPRILQAMAASDSTKTMLIQRADPTRRSKAWNDQKITAHHAIIPTAGTVSIHAMSREASQLYDLICRYYLVQFFPLFEYDRTVVDTMVQGETFRASGRVVIKSGWKEVLGAAPKKKTEEGEKEPCLPPVTKGEPATVEKITLEEKQTSPPPRYTEGTLIQAMKNVGKRVDNPRLRKILRETAGIGTEATRAAILETLLKRNLLAREGKKNLLSMPAGRALVDILPHSVTDPATTAVWEQALDDIAHAHGPLEAFLEKSEIWVTKLIANVKARQSMGIQSFAGLPPAPSTRRKAPGTATPTSSPACPQCGQPMCRRKSDRGWFWGCSTYPTCQTTLPDTQTTNRPGPNGSVTQNGPQCPQCNKGQLRERTAKKGKKSGNRFLGCSTYPQCRHTQPIGIERP